jgi:two-component system KDP operon response regulator KdpE
MSTVLVVDDEAAILRTMEVNLKARGYQVDLAISGTQALAMAARRHPDAIVLDLGLPDLDGIEVIRGLRGWTTVPIIVLSARTAEAQKVAALDAGANDYVTKPFGMDELMARLRVALRPASSAEQAPTVDTPDFTIDLAANRVRRDGHDVRLTATEWQVVELLARNAGRLITQRELLEQVWGLRDTKTNYVRVFMVAIRRKLEPQPGRPRYFITEPGSGIRFVPEGAPPQPTRPPEMSAAGWLQFAFFGVLIAISTPLLGIYMYRIYFTPSAPGDRVFKPVERFAYRVCCVDDTPLFLGLLLSVTLITVGLTYFPILALGPVVEQLAGHF